MPLPNPIGDDDSLEQLCTLLCAIAAGRPADRSEAVSYSTWRGALLASPYHELLPGFLLQCMSVAKFRDFITLYHPRLNVREAFVRDAFDEVRDRSTQKQRATPPPSRAWTL